MGPFRVARYFLASPTNAVDLGAGSSHTCNLGAWKHTFSVFLGDWPLRPVAWPQDLNARGSRLGAGGAGEEQLGRGSQ
jgi:hypothetical protein